ncbi:hypothetical protein ACS0TY_036974 [Phlomoides rotata]
MGFLGLQILAILVIFASPSSPAAIPKPDCPDHCGNVTIPFPFGTSPDCYLYDEFFVNCSNSFNPPKAFLTNSEIEITNISVINGTLTVLQTIGFDCYGPNQTNRNCWRNWF